MQASGVAESSSSEDDDVMMNKKVTPASISFVPSAAGLLIASEVIKDLTTK